MSRRNPSSTARQRRFMCAEYGRKKAGNTTTTKMTTAQLKEFCMKRKRSRNPHLTSAKWRYVGAFKKADVSVVKRILRIHGLANKITKEHRKEERRLTGGRQHRELYVKREDWDMAFRAITQLFEGGLAA